VPRDLRRHDTVPHAGFERDAIAFPQTSGNVRY
jgi:hypothetical protein